MRTASSIGVRHVFIDSTPKPQLIAATTAACSADGGGCGQRFLSAAVSCRPSFFQGPDRFHTAELECRAA
jgi:hypothetical protein